MATSPVHGTSMACVDRPAADWSLQVPLSALVDLQGLPERMNKLEAENKQLRRELEALRLIQSQTMQLLADMRRERIGG